MQIMLKFDASIPVSSSCQTARDTQPIGNRYAYNIINICQNKTPHQPTE